ncbi:uncharacterized protein LOC143427444 [Xylocopa sonorina]|uniref:uncharacterized protein LOC143427444 n=1 Tax=Xylocopa sonorina TaxID=1818115 RepID=UPI00403AB9BA
MAFKTDELLHEVTKLDAVQRMKASARSTLKCGAIVGASTIIGGILGGRVGLTLGGIASSLIVGYAAPEDLQSVPYIIIYETTPEQRTKLATKIIELLKTKYITQLRDFILAADNVELQAAIVQILIMFLNSEFGMSVIGN